MAYTLTKGEYRGAKSRLTRAKKTGDAKKIIEACEYCLALFERKGYPDSWHTWNVALEDARMQLERERLGI